MSGGDPTEELKAGRRALDGVPGVRILRDLFWHERLDVWSLHVRISIENAPSSRAVPARTDWYVRIDPLYPRGEIKVFPAKVDGLRGTFPHQSVNDDPGAELPWRRGDICLSTPRGSAFGRVAPGAPPRDPDSRLAWFIERARDWLHAAADGTLQRRGDVYELPAWKSAKGGRIVVFSESTSSFGAWRAAGARVGVADLADLDERYLAVIRWTDLGGKIVERATWGDAVSGQRKTFQAFWLRLRETPVLPPWQAPTTWGELLTVARKQGVKLENLLRQLLPRVGETRDSLLLVGFEIPAHVGEPPVEMCWQALVMPRLLSGKGRGFRRRPDCQWAKNRLGPLGDRAEIRWLQTENWHADRIAARGRLEEALRSSKIAVLGVGAVGSLLAECLVRGGAGDLLLVDGDELVIGNLVRHRLKMDSLERKKASAMAEELSLISPHVRVRAEDRRLPLDPAEARALLEDRDIVIDCTGDNAPLEVLSEARWDSPKLFVSVSVGYEARRLYFFSSRGERFPFESFVEQVERWLPSDREVAAADPLRFEGAGCWHPVWPGRFDDLMLLAATASKLVEAESARSSGAPGLQVFERRAEPGDVFAGLRRVREPPEACAA